jgi:dipeptidyl aminopeptidase/acylaminoacyl peptidase
VDPRTGRASGEPVRLAHGDAMANALAARGGTIAVLATIGARPPELAIAADGELRAIGSLGSAWIDGLAWPTMRVVEAPGPGGPIETWVASPAGAGDGPLPTIVDVHGGPLGGWTSAPSMEVVLLCARGYRVILPNIRGSASYGGEWIRPQLGEWGGPDADDVHASLDHVIGLGLADPSHLGVLGLSYGGFMVNWLIGTTDRFRAAVSENGVTNQVSAWAHSDGGPEYCRAARMGDPTTPEGVERLWRQSPLRHVAGVRTPLLMLQSEADKRCPPADNEQLFIALRWLGRTVEYVLYPEEYHVIQASGRIDRRIDRMTRVLEWFERYVPG